MKSLKLNNFSRIKNIKKGDQVKVIAGNQKGFLGIVKLINNKKSSILIEGILPRIKFSKKLQESKTEQKKLELPVFIHISNVMLWDKEINKVSRIGYKEQILVSENKAITNFKKLETKKRYFKKSGNFLP